MAGINWTTEIGSKIREQLQGELVIWMTTTSADGTPQPNPVWFVTDGDDVLVYSHRSASRNVNVARNPRVSLNFNSDPHASEMSVIIGTAVVDDSFPMANESPAFVAKYGDLVPGLDMTPEEHAETYPVAIRITPEKIRGW